MSYFFESVGLFLFEHSFLWDVMGDNGLCTGVAILCSSSQLFHQEYCQKNTDQLTHQNITDLNSIMFALGLVKLELVSLAPTPLEDGVMFMSKGQILTQQMEMFTIVNLK